jgi:hypothetical protein
MGIGGRKYIPEDRLLSKEDFLASLLPTDYKEVINKVNDITNHAKELNKFESSFLKEELRKATFFKDKLKVSKKCAVILDDMYHQHVLGAKIEEKNKPDDEVRDIRRIRTWCKDNYITLGGEIHFRYLHRIADGLGMPENRARYILGLLKTTVMVEDIVL